MLTISDRLTDDLPVAASDKSFSEADFGIVFLLPVLSNFCKFLLVSDLFTLDMAAVSKLSRQWRDQTLYRDKICRDSWKNLWPRGAKYLSGLKQSRIAALASWVAFSLQSWESDLIISELLRTVSSGIAIS